MRRHVRVIPLFLLFAALVVPPWSLAGAQVDRAVRDAAVAAAVQVAVNAEWIENDFSTPLPLPLGSGTVVSPDGLILTNAHVVDRSDVAAQVADVESFIQQDSPSVQLEYPSDRFLILVSDGVHPPEPAYLASVVEIDQEVDLAILRIDGRDGGSRLPASFSLPHVPVGDSDALGLGDPLHIFAYPSSGGDALTYTSGVVSGFNFEDGIEGPAWVNTDAVISGGSSGGTAVNDRGELVGIPTQGSSLDCRPGDTDGDGRITPDDVGCIPTGGSIGQLRPVNLAKSMLTAAGAAEIRPTATPSPTALPAPNPTAALEPPAGSSTRDLPALALAPADLADERLGEFLVLSGQLVPPDRIPQLALGPTAGTSPEGMDGLAQAYGLALVPVDRPEEALWSSGSVTSVLWEFDDATAATNGFDRLAAGWGGSRSIDHPMVVGDDTRLTQTTFDAGDGRMFQSLTFTFRQSDVVAVIDTSFPEAQALAPATLERLARRLATRLDAPAPVTAPLSALVARFGDGSGVGGFDAYLVLGGVAHRPSWVTDATADDILGYWSTVGGRAVYNYTLWLPTDATTATAMLDVNAVRFLSSERASQWLRWQERDARESGARDVRRIEGTPAWGDERLVLSFRADWWADPGDESHLRAFVRTGDTVVQMTFVAVEDFDAASAFPIVDAQAACLPVGCADLVVPLPSSIADLIGDGATAEATPSSTPTPSPTPVPTPTPRPTATPEFGFVDGFAVPIDGWVFDDGGAAGEFSGGTYSLSVSQTQYPSLFTFDTVPSAGRDIGWMVAVAEAAGAGEVLLPVQSGDDGSTWFFSVDPGNRTWSLYRKSVLDEYFVWVEPRPFSAGADGPLGLEVRVRGGRPTLLIDGVDVVAQHGINMPDLGDDVVIGFGVGIDPLGANGWSGSFTARFDRIRLYALP